MSMKKGHSLLLFVAVIVVFFSSQTVEAVTVRDGNQPIEVINVNSKKPEILKNNIRKANTPTFKIVPSFPKNQESDNKNTESNKQSVSIQSAVTTGSTEIDLGLDFLRSVQSPNGNFGNMINISSLVDTFVVADLFDGLELSTDTNYQNALTWLGKQYYESTLDEALKLLALRGDGQDVLYSVEPLVIRQNTDDGGFGYSGAYESDTKTTATMLRLIDKSGYVDYGSNPDYSKIKTLLFLINSQNTDGGWGETVLADSDIHSTVQALEALHLHKEGILTTGGADVVISDIIGDALAYLKQAQGTNGKWNNSLMDTVFAYDILHKYGVALNYENQAFDYIKSEQGTNGSFSNGNVYVTSQAIKALSWRLRSLSPDLTITNIETVGSLVNREQAQFNVTIKNIGRSAVFPADVKFYNFTDDYNWLPGGATFLPAGTSLEPNQEIILSVFHSTEALLGTTKMKYYIEATGDSDESNNWGTKTVNFETSLTNIPAIQTYFVAHKYDSADGKPAIKYYWPLKSDPNRLNYVILYREAGVTTWSGFNIPNTSNIIFLNGLKEGVTYQATVGVKDKNTSSVIYLNNYASIKTSATRTNYTGSASGKLTLNSAPLGSSSLSGYGLETIINTDSSGNFTLSGLQNGTASILSQGLENDKITTKFDVGVDTTISGVRVFTRIAPDTTAPVVNFVRIKNNTSFIINNNAVSTIEVSASDDINTKEADISYYNPNTSSWIFIETIPLSGNVGAYSLYDWNVPAQISGAGFKLKAVVRDHSGNQASGEYGPFTINDTTNVAPTISIINPDGISDNADTTYAITWTDSDPDSSATISLYYDNDRAGLNGTLIASGISEDNAINEYNWNTTNIAKGEYYIYATITDGIAPIVSAYSTGKVTIAHPPLTPTGLSAIAVNSCGAGTINISWNTTSDTTAYSLRDGANVIYTGATNSFSHTGLVAGSSHDYTVRAENSVGNSAYSSVVSETASADCNLPSVSTTTLTNITQTTASSGGEVTSDGGAPVTARGIVWSEVENPTIALTTKTSDGAGTGTFASSITGLSAGTLYHVRAYATNSVGTSYGADMTFTTVSLPVVDKWDLFIDTLATGWSVLTKNVTGTIPDTTRFYSGTASMKLVSIKANSQFTIKKTAGSENSTGKNNLTFALQSDVNIPSSNFKVRLLNATGGTLSNVRLKSYGPLTLDANTWYTYSIPLSALKGLNKELSGVRFIFSKTGTFYIDELKLQ